VLDPAHAGDQAKSRLGLAEDRRPSRGKTHVARQHELAAGAAPGDLGDGDEAGYAQVAKEQAE